MLTRYMLLRALVSAALASLAGSAAGPRAAALSPLLLASPALAASAPGGASPVARDAASRDRLPQSPAQLWVDCQHGSDAAAGVSPEAAVRTIQRALALRRGEATPAMFGTGTVIINVVGGRRCEIAAATLTLRQADSNTILRGDGRTALSGGRAIRNFASSNGGGGGGGDVLAAAVPPGFPAELKGARRGGQLLQRARWPKKVGDGLATSNWLFAMDWSHSFCPAPCTGSTASTGPTPQVLGLDPVRLPPRVNLSELVGSFVHILGNGEKDVLGQVSVIDSVNITDPARPTVTFRARDHFTVGQRLFLENVPSSWQIAEGKFFHDSSANQLFVRLPPSAVGSASELEVVVPVLETVMALDGAAHIGLSNLTFLDSSYFADGQWDGPARVPSDAVIRINNSTCVTVEAANFLGSVGGYGIAIGNGTSNVTVVGCLFDSVGQGGVIAYGLDNGPANTKPDKLTISHNVMQSIGKTLDHVAGVAFRSASHSRISHNRVSGSTRCGIQVDTFYTGDAYAGSSRENVISFNIVHDTCLTTTDCGAVESLGVGDPADYGSGAGWDSGNVFRHNNISRTIGSSSSDGKTVCVHGQPSEGCRNMVWGLYFDDTNSGNVVDSNYIGATIHGSFLDNLGGNNSHTNNVFIGENEDEDEKGMQSTLFLANFGSPGASAKHPVGRNISGSSLHRNIFFFTSKCTSIISSVYGSWSPSQLKPDGADHNLYFSPTLDIATYPGFPGGETFRAWQGASAVLWPPTCEDMKGSAGTLQLGAGAACSRGAGITTRPTGSCVPEPPASGLHRKAFGTPCRLTVPAVGKIVLLAHRTRASASASTPTRGHRNRQQLTAPAGS